MAQGLAANGSTSGLGAAIALQRGKQQRRPNGNGGKQGNGQRGGKPKFNPMKVLKGLSSSEVLSPEQIASAARALSGLETGAEVHGYKRLASELGNEKDLETQGLTNLGKRTTGQVGSVYSNIAKSAAQSLANQSAIAGSLAGQSAAISSAGTQELAKTQEGALGGLEQQLQMRGAEGTQGSAQGALAQAVAAQQAQQQAYAGAANQAATQQGEGYTGLLAAEAQAAQNQGGETIGQIGRAVAGRTIKTDNEYGQSIKTALQKAGEAKATKGEKFTKDLLGLREGDQKFILGKDAVQGEKAKLGLAATELGVEKEQNAIANKIAQQKANASTTSAEASKTSSEASSLSASASAKNAATAAWKAHHPEATKKEEKKAEEYMGEVKSYLPSAVATYGAPKNPKMLNQFIGAVNKEVSAPPQIVRSVLERWFAKKQREEVIKKASTPLAGF